ncbi:MAG TPA: hypothetical protein VLD58_16355 [Gemmatimonadales bacterium]|nr:hypothetical protein [Gemmatimonadales bacterium]
MRCSILLLGSCLLACSGAPSQPVPVVGSATDVATMAGEWAGFYEADDGTRGGTIDFHLKAGSDTAQGDILMVPREWGQPLESYDRPVADAANAPSPRTLTIRFVGIRGDSVSGRLDPFRDPACGCRVQSTFAGHLKGNTLKGRYESYHEETGRVVTGKWQAKRKT